MNEHVSFEAQQNMMASAFASAEAGEDPNVLWARLLDLCAISRGYRLRETNIEATMHMRGRRLEEESAELRALNEAWDHNVDEVLDVKDRIAELPPCPNALAAKLMAEGSWDMGKHEPVSHSSMSLPLIALPAMLPLLTGEIADTARHFLANPDMPGEQCPLWA